MLRDLFSHDERELTTAMKNHCDMLTFLCGLHIVFSMLISISRADLRCAISLLGLVASVERKKRQITVFLVLTILSQVVDLAWVGVHGQYAQEFAFAQLDHAPAFVANIVRSHIFALVLSFFQIVFTVITVVFTLLILCSKKYGSDSSKSLSNNDQLKTEADPPTNI